MFCEGLFVYGLVSLDKGYTCIYSHFAKLLALLASVNSVLPTFPELPGVSRISQPFCLDLPAPGSFHEIHGISII